jgi:hypothetical protein
MIYILEVPHRFQPFVWRRATKREVVSAIHEAFSRRGDTIPDTFVGAVRYNGEDLETYRVYMNQNEALNGLDRDITLSPKVRDALRRALIDMDVLADV